jgi:undecaprenyl pyrophosphate phosphatase UppP
MRGIKLILCIICAILTVAAIITVIIVFRNEIVRFFVDLKDKLDEKRFRRNGEYEDYVD